MERQEVNLPETNSSTANAPENIFKKLRKGDSYWKPVIF